MPQEAGLQINARLIVEFANPATALAVIVYLCVTEKRLSAAKSAACTLVPIALKVNWLSNAPDNRPFALSTKVSSVTVQPAGKTLDVNELVKSVC